MPVEGAPFSATVEIKKETIPGIASFSDTINEIARDNAGRIHNEIRQAMPEGFTGTPEIIEVHIFDPQTRLNTYYDPRTRMASQRVLPWQPIDLNAHLLAAHKPQSKDLGTAVLNGIKCRGTLKTYTPQSSNGTFKGPPVSDEFWYSEDLHLDILTTHSISGAVVKTVAVLDVKREPPNPALFEVPEGYKIVNVTLPRSTLLKPQAQR